VVNIISLDKVKRQLLKVPRNIVSKLKGWVVAVEELGLEEVRKSPGYHDEPLVGKRKGERSIRLSLKWRAIYVIKSNGKVDFVS
jgi:toxin HigB-1